MDGWISYIKTIHPSIPAASRYEVWYALAKPQKT